MTTEDRPPLHPLTELAQLMDATQDLCDHFTRNVLHPYLRAEGLGDWDRYRLVYEAAPIPIHADGTGD